MLVSIRSMEVYDKLDIITAVWSQIVRYIYTYSHTKLERVFSQGCAYIKSVDACVRFFLNLSRSITIFTYADAARWHWNEGERSVPQDSASIQIALAARPFLCISAARGIWAPQSVAPASIPPSPARFDMRELSELTIRNDRWRRAVRAPPPPPCDHSAISWYADTHYLNPRTTAAPPPSHGIMRMDMHVLATIPAIT